MCRCERKVAWPAWALLMLSACGGCGRDARVDEVPLSQQFEQALRRTDPESRASQLIGVALRQGRARDMAGARRSLEAASRACAEITDALGRATSMSRLADAQALLGMQSAARDTLHRVRETLEVDSVDNPESRITVLARMALTYGRYLDNADAARSTLQEAETIANQLQDATARIRGLSVAAYAHGRLKNEDQAQRLVDQAVRIARELEDPRQRSDGLGEAAAAWGATSQPRQAIALLDEALASARQIKDPVSQAHALADLAARLGRARQTEKARTVLAEAERAADRINDRGLQQEVMEKIRLGRS